MRFLSGIVAIGLAFLLFAYASTRPHLDFIEYWTGAHLLVAGGNPYSLSDTLRMQRALGWTESIPLTNLTPPWAMPIFAPIGIFRSYAVAWLVWFVFLTGCVWYSTKHLLDCYANRQNIFPREQLWREPLLARFRYYNLAGYFSLVDEFLFKKPTFDVAAVRLFDRAIFSVVHGSESRVCSAPLSKV